MKSERTKNHEFLHCLCVFIRRRSQLDGTVGYFKDEPNQKRQFARRNSERESEWDWEAEKGIKTGRWDCDGRLSMMTGRDWKGTGQGWQTLSPWLFQCLRPNNSFHQQHQPPRIGWVGPSVGLLNIILLLLCVLLITYILMSARGSVHGFTGKTEDAGKTMINDCAPRVGFWFWTLCFCWYLLRQQILKFDYYT